MHGNLAPERFQSYTETGFQVQKYRDTESGRYRWAVLHPESGCWYFPQRYGKRAAAELCSKMRRESGRWIVR